MIYLLIHVNINAHFVAICVLHRVRHLFAFLHAKIKEIKLENFRLRIAGTVL